MRQKNLFNIIQQYIYTISPKYINIEMTNNNTFHQEFNDLWEGLKGMDDDEEEEKEIREEFNRMDIDRSGYITQDEMLKVITTHRALRNMEAEANKCLDEIDVDGNGKVSYPEFIMVWKFKS